MQQQFITTGTMKTYQEDLTFPRAIEGLSEEVTAE